METSGTSKARNMEIPRNTLLSTIQEKADEIAASPLPEKTKQELSGLIADDLFFIKDVEGKTSAEMKKDVSVIRAKANKWRKTSIISGLSVAGALGIAGAFIPELRLILGSVLAVDLFAGIALTTYFGDNAKDAYEKGKTITKWENFINRMNKCL